MDTTVLTATSGDGGEDAGRRHGIVVALMAVAAILAGHGGLTVARAVVNLPVSAAAVVWAKAHHGHCLVRSDLTVSCDHLRGGYANAGTTYGNVWLYGSKGGRDRQRHESRHSDQWAMFNGGLLFPVLYGVEFVRTGGDFHHNVFEQWAGLHDGGYSAAPSQNTEQSEHAERSEQRAGPDLDRPSIRTGLCDYFRVNGCSSSHPPRLPRSPGS